MMEGCSVCACAEDEIPKPWLDKSKSTGKSSSNDYGWITAGNSVYGFEGKGHDDSLGRISVADGEKSGFTLEQMFNTFDGSVDLGYALEDLENHSGIVPYFIVALAMANFFTCFS
jgi:hypothetical protein